MSGENPWVRVAGGGGLHEWAGAVVQVRDQAHRGVGPEHVDVVDHLVDDPTEVGVVACHDPHDEVTHPVIEWISRTSGIAARCATTGAWPCRCRISKVQKAVTG